MAGKGFAKAYLSEPIDVEELALQVARLPIIKYQCEGSVYPRKTHYSKRPFFVRITCNKVGAIGRLDYPGVVCSLTWGITDCEDNVRKANTRYLYVQATRDWHMYEENWQPEVNRLMEAICLLIYPLIIDAPTKHTLNRRENATRWYVKKVSLQEALQKAQGVVELAMQEALLGASASGTGASAPGAAQVSIIRQASLSLLNIRHHADWEDHVRNLSDSELVSIALGIDAPPKRPLAILAGGETAQGASATGTLSVASTETPGASALGTPRPQVSLPDISRGFTKDENGNIVLQSYYSLLKAWIWLVNHRQRMPNIPEDGVIQEGDTCFY